MLTVGSSSATPASAKGDTAEVAAKDSRKRVPLIAIPITLAVGLLVASGYVGNRILSSRKQATAVVVASVPTSWPAAVAAAPAPAEAETPRSSEAPAQSTAPPHAASAPASEAAAAVTAKRAVGETTSAKGDQSDVVESDTAPGAQSGSEGLIAPRHGERYLQIAAISASAAQKFLAGLGRHNLQASVAPGPHDGLVRVVIGPFPDRESVAAVKAQIESKWPDCFVRLY